MDPTPDRIHELTVDETEGAVRLDVFLAGAIADASRSFIKKLIKEGRVQVNGAASTKPARPLQAGERVRVALPPPQAMEPGPEAIPLDILHEDADVIVINKPPGLVVHPAPGNESGTLVNALLHHCPDLERTGGDPARPGIVHRLDRDTSGVLVVAKTQQAHDELARQAGERTFDRRYLALVYGMPKEDRGRIEAQIGRSLSDRSRMAVTEFNAREAVTRFEVLERFGPASLVALQLETGRTHQIRVHMRYAGNPVLGDPAYGVTDYRRMRLPQPVREALEALVGQALHAETLGFLHPISGETCTFSAPPPEDFQRALAELRAQAGG